MIKNEIRILFTALMFYTRIPVPKWTGFSTENLNKATRYFPFVGIIVGGVGAGIFYACSFVLPLQLSVLLSMAATILLTGAFHEDGFSDSCDGFGGGYSPEQIMRIMKDSRIGTYGAIGLVLILLSKFFSLTAMELSLIPIAIIVAHAYSRFNPVLLIFTLNYVSDPDKSKSKPIGVKSDWKTFAIAFILSIIPFALIEPQWITILMISQFIIFILFREYTKKKIGGYTGDVLGAMQQLSEVGVYICLIVLSRFS